MPKEVQSLDPNQLFKAEFGKLNGMIRLIMEDTLRLKPDMIAAADVLAKAASELRRVALSNATK